MLNLSYSHQRGFTLVELMVAIALGLLVVAMAVNFLLTSANSQRIQSGAQNVQEVEVFSLDYIQKEIAMANLGSYRPMTWDSAWTGIVISAETPADKDGYVKGNLRGVTQTNIDKLITLANQTPANIKNSSIKSDQLTIQYKAPFDMQDCEGRNVTRGEMVIERFFTQVDTTKMNNESDDLAITLRCDAGRYRIAGDADPNLVKAGSIGAISDFGNNSVIMANRVDAFKVMLGLQQPDGISYLALSDYLANKSTTYKDSKIVAIKLGVLARGVNPITTTTETQFNLLGQAIELKDTSANFMRQIYETTIRLRNHGMEK